MKKELISAAAVAILTVGMVSTSEAFWFVKAKNEMNKVSAGRDANSGKNSFNRTNAHNVSRSKNVITGNGGNVTGGSGNGNNGSASASASKGGGGWGWFGYGRGGSGSAAASASLGEWKNSGTVGNGISGTTISGLTAGDTVNTGSTYNNINNGSDAVRENGLTERARIQAGR